MEATRFVGRFLVNRICLVVAVTMLTTCGDDDSTAPGGGGGGGGTPSASFLDCWVSGLEYSAVSPPIVTGLTGEGGILDVTLGENVTFKVGDIVLGSGVSGPCMNPIEITNSTDIFEYPPTNIARFLQTIDDDDEPSNGISIIEAVRTAAAGRTLNFDQHPDAFAADTLVISVVEAMTGVTAADPRPLVATDVARAHLEATLFMAYHADYNGLFEGSRGSEDWSGEWDLAIDANGNIVGALLPWSGGRVDITGSLQSNGTFSCDDVGVTGLFFSGRISRGDDGLHKVEGFWNDYQQGSVTFTGGRRTVYPQTFPCP